MRAHTASEGGSRFSASSSSISVNTAFSSRSSDTGCLTPSTAPSSPPSLYAEKEPASYFDVPGRFRSGEDTSCASCSRVCRQLPKATDVGQIIVAGKNLPVNGIKDRIGSQLAPQVAAVHQTKGRPLRIVGVLASQNEGCHMYSAMTAKALDQMDVQYDLVDMRAGGSLVDVQAKIMELNRDADVDGLIFYTPCFGETQDKEVRSWISPRIDVEGFHRAYWAEAMTTAPPLLSDSLSSSPIYPCTPLAVVRALQMQGTYDVRAQRGSRMAGKVVTIVNRSDTVGLPLAAMLSNESATVFSVDITSTQIWEKHDESSEPCISSTDINPYAISDIVISAVPSPFFKIRTASLKAGAIAINVASGFSNFEDDVKTRAGYYAQRTGALTITMLVMNALALRARNS